MVEAGDRRAVGDARGSRRGRGRRWSQRSRSANDLGAAIGVDLGDEVRDLDGVGLDGVDGVDLGAAIGVDLGAKVDAAAVRRWLQR